MRERDKLLAERHDRIHLSRSGFRRPSSGALRQNRARTTLWDADESNFADLKNITNPMLLADGRDDVVDKPVNSVNMARQKTSLLRMAAR